MSGIEMTLSSGSITLKEGTGAVTASVTNSATASQRIVLRAYSGNGVSPPDTRERTDPASWATIDESLRTIAAGATEQYNVAFDAKAAPGGTYSVNLNAYSADEPPEANSGEVLSLEILVPPADQPGKPKRFPWWMVAAGAGLLAVIGIVVFLMWPKGTEVPEVTDGSLSLAVELLEKAELQPKVETVESDRAPDTVLTQDPPAGTKVARESVVSLGVAIKPADKCQPGYVYRLVVPDDEVCVTPESAAQVLVDNAEITQLRRKPNPPGGPYGVNTCLQGFVWRDAYNGDQICVTGETRSRTAQENAEADSHRAP
jgi:hypothetical protein